MDAGGQRPCDDPARQGEAGPHYRDRHAALEQAAYPRPTQAALLHAERPGENALQLLPSPHCLSPRRFLCSLSPSPLLEPRRPYTAALTAAALIYCTHRRCPHRKPPSPPQAWISELASDPHFLELDAPVATILDELLCLRPYLILFAGTAAGALRFELKRKKRSGGMAVDTLVDVDLRRCCFFVSTRLQRPETGTPPFRPPVRRARLTLREALLCAAAGGAPSVVRRRRLRRMSQLVPRRWRSEPVAPTPLWTSEGVAPFVVEGQAAAAALDKSLAAAVGFAVAPIPPAQASAVESVATLTGLLARGMRGGGSSLRPDEALQAVRLQLWAIYLRLPSAAPPAEYEAWRDAGLVVAMLELLVLAPSLCRLERRAGRP